MSQDVRNRLLIFAGVVLFAFLFLLPTITPGTFKDFRWLSKPLSLGLDLQGGVYLLYEVQTEEAVKNRLERSKMDLRNELRSRRIPVLRAKVTPGNSLELTLLRKSFGEEAKKAIAEVNKELQFKDEIEEGSSLRLTYAYDQKQVAEIKRKAVLQAVETLRNRVDQFGVSEPLIQRTGQNRIILQMPGASDVDSVRRVVGSVAQLEFRFLPNTETAPYAVDFIDRETKSKIRVEDEVQMTGDDVDGAEVSVYNGQVEVILIMTTEGGRRFRRVTEAGRGRQLAIILDKEVYSAPTIQEAIAGGRASITGSFSMKEARELAIVLRAGALPAPLKEMEVRTVGPTLGQESIERGVEAIALGFVLIIVFMAIYYGKAGWVAVGSLSVNLLLVMAALSAFGATLTLPGLAGLALTVGMAVDANVIIFERIREELRVGASRDAAVRAGFDKAFSAIIDANLTTLLAGVILYFLGSGPIRGFAVTLSIGILTTLYCATFVTRLAFDAMPLKGRKELSI